MKTVIVTGASSGLGREFAEVLGNLPEVEEIWLIARRGDRLVELQATIRAKVIPFSLDLSLFSSLEQYRMALADRNPEVLALVNAAGYGRFGEVEHISLLDQLGMVDVNVSALTAITYHTLPYMERGGEIYQIASRSAFQPVPYMSVYGATKSYVLSFSRALNRELKHREIHVMAVCPGWIRTEFFDRAAQQPDVIQYYNRFHNVSQVVRRSIRDMKKRRDVSVCGPTLRFQRFLAKILPHRFVMWVWCRQQKK